MNALLIPYPEIDPVLVQLGPFAIRWYALAYIAGLVIGWQIMRRVCEQPPKLLTPVKIDDFLLWAALGVILGGRLGYVLFYKPGFYLSEPARHPDPVGRRHVLPWRAAGRRRRHPGLRPAQQGRSLHAVGSGGARGADRPVLRPAGQLHQWRAVGPRHRRAVGDDLSARRPAAAPSQPALPGLLRRRGGACSCSWPSGASPTAGAGRAC